MLSSLIHRDEPRRRQEPALDSTPVEGGKLELLSAMDIFRDLSEADIDALMDSTPMRTAPKGTIFYGAEDGPEVLFLLKSGKVELYRESPDGKKLTLAIVEQGSFFGEMSLVGQRLLGTCALALEDSVICALSRHDVEALILEHPSAAFRIIEVLGHRLQQSRARKQCGGHDSEHGHRFGGAGHRCPPSGSEEEEDRRDQRAGMRDADPENEVGDVDGPENRMLVPGDTHPGPSLVEKREYADRERDDRQHQPDVVERPGRPECAQDVVVDLREAHASRVTFFR